MLKFLSFVYDATSSTQSEAARQLAQRVRCGSHEWQLALDTYGLIVYYNDTRGGCAECHPLQGEAGVVLGTFFERQSIGGVITRTTRPSIGLRQSANIIATAGEQLITTHWGSYVAFLCNVRAARKWIIRSPGGHLPCFWTKCEDVYIYFSRDYAPADPAPRTIDWGYIAAQIVMPRESHRTGLVGVGKVQPGERIEHYGTQLTHKQLWNPADIACSDVIEDPHRARLELREAAKSCVHAHASQHSGVLVNLSGGLDSSIVLGCLQDAPSRPTITCITHYSPGHNSDERAFARLAAERAGYQLIPWPRNSQINLEHMLQISRFPEPRNYVRRVEMSGVEAQFAQQYGATALFTGSGGDQLFCQNGAQLAVTDYMYSRRFRNLHRIAYHAAQLEALSIWKILGSAFKEGLLREYRDPLQQIRPYQNLLVAEKIKSLQQQRPSIPLWMQLSSRIPPGKRQQVISLTARTYYDPLEQPHSPLFVAALMSQPIMEVCLRTPTYLAISNGWYRAIARQAFTPDVPSAILRRRSKGGIGKHIAEIWIGNLPFAREILLDGALVKAGLLDRSRLELALSNRLSSGTEGKADLMDYLCIEAWIRKMTGTPAQQKAA